MKLFFDTNVLIAAVIESHVHHLKAFTLLERVQSGMDQGVISAHSLAEMYAVLTKAPLPVKHTPEQALLSIEENIVKYFQIVVLSASEYRSLIRESAIAGLQSGMIYDALILKAATKSGSDKFYTFNSKHFQKMSSPSLNANILMP